ncbi:MAG: hypothetical protein KME30_14255 [Iphinoe sp. HA4291-MV1]|jgi:hypothetical protein|nr:hypothetical protein [Iphinoe sp. HA4291-MV1]
MVIEAKHFDTRLNQWIHNDNNPSNADSLLKEELKNSLLEHFFPQAEFSFGHMDEKATADQLKNHPEGHKLLLSSKSRLLYGPEEYLETISKLCPDNKDRGAYGSIFLGSCKNAINAELNILIVDDSTGENGGIINNDQAYRLTGDCYGQISTELYQKLTGHQEGDQYRVIQHRFGWTDKDGNDDKLRFGKGILRPANLDQILNYQNPNQPKIDLIIPLSAFKGTDKDNPNGPTKPQIKPGLYRQNIWLGEKSQSELGKTAISQMIASFPNGLKDFAETAELEAAKLKKALDDPRKIAQLYCEKYEKRKAFLEQQAAELEEEAAVDQEVAEEFEKLQERIATDTNIYKLIKTDLQGWGQLLETEKIQRELARFVQGEWQDISVGKTLTFERAMVIPSKDLRDGEVCIPHYQDSEQVLNFRSPFLNSNGLCTSTNKIVDDIIGPDGKPLAGVIAVSDETSERIYNRLNSQIKSILPELQEKNIQLEGIENYLDQNIGKLETRDKIEFTNKFNEYIKLLNNKGYQLEILPQESEQERQARDYDGDCIGFDHASKYPNLTAEAIWRNVPENAYDPIVKLKKQSFYRENGTQPEFEEIAIHMSDAISVGVINNHLTSIEALESEITILKTFGSEKDQIEYVIQVAKHYEKLFDQENSAQAHGDTSHDISNKYRGYMEEFVQTLRQEPLTQENALFAMDINTQIYREMVAEAAFQNQIAVDLFKSAKKPEMDVIRNNSRILHREVNYIRDKKKDVYFDSTIEPTGHSPVEILISKTNQYFEKAQLESRELAQFSNLFKGVEFTYEQRLQATLAKREFDKEFNNATRYTQRKKTEKGPSASIDIGNGKKLDVTNILKYNHPLIWNAQKITLKVSEIPPEKRSIDKPHQYRVYAQINDEIENAKPKFRTLGTVSKEQENSLQELGIIPNREITSTKISFQPELSEGQIKLMYQKAYQIAEDFYNSISDSEAGRDAPSGVAKGDRVLEQKLAMAAATWAVSTTREGSNSRSQQNEVEQEVERQKKVSNFVFASFTQEIIQQVDKLQFTDFTLTAHKHKSETIKQVNQNNPQEIRFNISEQKDSRGNTVIKDVIEVKNPETGEYETFANINATDGKLPIGTTATGTIKKGEVYTATAKINIPRVINLEFHVKELQKFQCKDQKFNGEEVNLIILKDKLEREDYVITFKNSYKEDKLGTVSKESVIAGIEQGWLAEKPGQGGQKVQLEITSIATGENAFAIGKTANGNLVRIDINDKLKNRNFQGQEITATVKAYDKQDVYTAKIGNLSLGIIGQHTEKAFGNRSRYSQKKSTVQQLVDAGIINESKVQTTIPVILTSNETTCKLTIDLKSVQYPETWVKRYHLVDQQKKVNPVEQKNNQLFDKITERPTIIFQSEEDKLVGLVGLAVDSKKSEVTKEFLERVGITYDQVAKSQSRLEAKKGMTGFMLDESTITPKRKEQFIERFGGIKSNDTPPLPAPIIPEQTVYFSNPNQQYTLENNSQVIKESIGLVVPAQDAIIVNSWLESKGTNNNYIIDTNSNIAIFIIEKDTVSSELEEGLNSLLGEAINIGEIDGFDQYEQLSNKLNQKVEKEGSLLEINSTLQPSEYEQALQSLPNRPKEIGKEEIPLPIVSAKPVQEDSTNDKELNILQKSVSPISKTVVEVNPPTEKIVQAIELSKLGDFDSSDGLGAALSNATTLAKEQGKLQNDYPVSVGNNPTAPAGQYGTETHTAKAEGVPYTSAEQAFNHQKQINPSFCDEYKLMVTVLQAKLEQHPRLAETITKRGGTKWLENCTNITNSQDKQWEGKGKESAFIRALSEAYTNVVEKNIAPTPETSTTNNPLANLEPINPAVEHMKKDIAMAEVATQFIGKSAASPKTPSSTRNYEQAWSESPLDNHTAEPIQLTSNQKLESESQGKNTETSFTPKLGAKNISPPTSVKNQTESSQTLNTDIQQTLLQTSTNRQTKSIDKTLDNIKQSTIQSLQNWYKVAQKLGRAEKYINRIQEVTEQYINESSYSLDNAFQAMSRDIKELQQIDEMTTLAQRVVQNFGKEDVNGIMSVRTENYKNYQIATQAQEKNYLIKDKDSNILLYIRDGKTQVNNLNEEIVNDFRYMNSRIENRLQSVKIEIL